MRSCVYGIDVGGTAVKIGRFAASDLKLIKKWTIETDNNGGGEKVLNDIAEAIKKDLEEASAEEMTIAVGVGIGVPGPVNDGVINRGVNLNWGEFNVEKTFSDCSGLPALAMNDAVAATAGEFFMGSARGCKNAVIVTLGTGIGGGIVIDGELRYGNSGAMGSIGHICVNPEETERCSCGSYGCLEQYVGRAGILKNYFEKAGISPTPDIDVKDVFEKAAAMDPDAIATVDETAFLLGSSLSGVGAILDPELFIIGGGISNAGEPFLEKIRDSYRKHAFHAVANARIVQAAFGENAGIHGAAALFLRKYYQKIGG